MVACTAAVVDCAAAVVIFYCRSGVLHSSSDARQQASLTVSRSAEHQRGVQRRGRGQQMAAPDAQQATLGSEGVALARK